MNYQIHTFGCKVNTYDTGLLQKNLHSSGFEISQLAQIHILNTCAVTKEATKEAVRLAKRLKVKDPMATVVVTGCSAQVDTDAFSDLAGVDLVIANSHKGQLPQILDRYLKGQIDQKVFKSNIFRKDDVEAGGGIESQHTRSFLKIQDGCNSFCTYCVIPYARGKSRSIPIAELVTQIQRMYEQGVLEVVLTGVHIGDYEDETKTQKNRLEDLIETILNQTSIPRVRLTSLEPIELSQRLLDLYKNPKMCRHIHLSVQSANTKVLRNMKRNYTQKEVVEALSQIQEKLPGCYVGMDVITGFPTESDEDFLDTVGVLSESHWTRLHVFPYSERPGTKAASFTDQVPIALRRERAYQLRQLSHHRLQIEAQKHLNQAKSVLILKSYQNDQKTFYTGLSSDYWPVEVEADGLPLIQGQQYAVSFDQFLIDDHKAIDGIFRGKVLSDQAVLI